MIQDLSISSFEGPGIRRVAPVVGEGKSDRAAGGSCKSGEVWFTVRRLENRNKHVQPMVRDRIGYLAAHPHVRKERAESIQLNHMAEHIDISPLLEAAEDPLPFFKLR